jgi:hypothetical protein
MAITYTWKLKSFKKVSRDNLTDVVFQTYWDKTGTDEDGDSGTFTGATPFDPAQVDPNNFTPYESLTEEIVLGWIKSVVVGSYETHVNEQIAKQLQDKKFVPTEHNEDSFPWSTSTGTSFTPPPTSPV